MPHPMPETYAVLLMASNARQLFLAHPVHIERFPPGPYGPYGRAVYHGGLRIRFSRPVDAMLADQVLDVVEGDLPPADSFMAPIRSLCAYPWLAHVLLPIFWAWGYAQRTNEPPHPAGEPVNDWRWTG
jgi:hypothetical protein